MFSIMYSRSNPLRWLYICTVNNSTTSALDNHILSRHLYVWVLLIHEKYRLANDLVWVSKYQSWCYSNIKSMWFKTSDDKIPNFIDSKPPPLSLFWRIQALNVFREKGQFKNFKPFVTFFKSHYFVKIKICFLYRQLNLY